jgi:glycosyltransferase involved in cell wall biosynthesis
MRIGIEAQRIFRRNKHGMDFVALEMIRELQTLDRENEYFIFANHGPDTACLQEQSNFHLVIFGGLYPVWEQFSLRKKVKEYQLDVLHCTSNTAPIWLKTRLIVTIHDVIYYELNPFRTKGYSHYQFFGNLYRRFVVKRLLPDVEKVITVSDYERGQIEKVLPIESRKLTVVYNGVGKHFKPVTDEVTLNSLRSQYQLPADFLLFLGNTDPKKNTENTILAFARFCKMYKTPYKLVVGDLEPQLVHALLERAGMLEFMDVFHFTGYIRNQDMPGMLSLAKLFLYPSKRESFGIPLLESMACGTAVITGNTSSMPEVAGEAAYLVDSEDQGAIAEAIHTLLSEDTVRNSLIEKGYIRASQFSWKQTAEAVLTLYKQPSVYA